MSAEKRDNKKRVKTIEKRRKHIFCKIEKKYQPVKYFATYKVNSLYFN